MNKKNSYICLLGAIGLTLLIFGNYVRGVGSAKLLSESVSIRLFGGPTTGCQHQCQNGSCCNDTDTCDEWHADQPRCDSTNARYNTNGKQDWVCKPKDGYNNCDATQNKQDCAESKLCYYDYCMLQCLAEEEANKTWNEAMKCTDKDGDHTS